MEFKMEMPGFKLEALVQPEIQDLEGVSIRDLDCAAKIPYCSLSDSSLGRRETIKKRTSEGESGSAAMGKRVPVGSLVVGVDLVPIALVRGVFSIQQDITKLECTARLRKLIKKNECSAFDLMLHDGSPNDKPHTPIKQDTNK
ncbi:hypothetical protein PS1_006548 [Malus domestica]